MSTAHPSDIFHDEDLLVTHTDDQNRILAASLSFQRVSGYTAEELIGASDKMVRHEDMPEGIGWLYNQELKAGHPVAAFLKNKSKSGKSYWVLSLATPIDGGYIAARLKPRADVVSNMELAYTTLRDREIKEGLAPAESAAVFLTHLKEQGYKTYADFMAKMVIHQSCARTTALGRQPLEALVDMQNLIDQWQDMEKTCFAMQDLHQDIAHTPANLRVQAAHLNEKGIPLSVIASNFTVLTQDISHMLESFSAGSAEVAENLRQAYFLVGLDAIMTETMVLLKAEVAEGKDTTNLEEVNLIEKQTAFYSEKTTTSIKQVQTTLRQFGRIAEDTATILSGLSVAKVMCEIENAYISGVSDSSVSATISELDSFQETARQELATLRKALFKSQKLVDRAHRRIFVDARQKSVSRKVAA